MRFVVVYIFPDCNNELRLLLAFPPSIVSSDTKGNKEGKWISPDLMFTIFGLLRSIISSGVEPPVWFKLSNPNKFKNVSPPSDLSLTGVEKLSTILTSRLL